MFDELANPNLDKEKEKGIRLEKEIETLQEVIKNVEFMISEKLDELNNINFPDRNEIALS